MVRKWTHCRCIPGVFFYRYGFAISRCGWVAYFGLGLVAVRVYESGLVYFSRFSKLWHLFFLMLRLSLFVYFVSRDFTTLEFTNFHFRLSNPYLTKMTNSVVKTWLRYQLAVKSYKIETSEYSNFKIEIAISSSWLQFPRYEII